MKFFTAVFSRMFLVGAAGAAVLVFTAPSLPWWGERHAPHVHKPPLPLSSGHTVGQTFVAEEAIMDRIVVWVDQDLLPLPKQGGLHLKVEVPNGKRESAVRFADIPPSGMTLFRLTPPLPARQNSRGTFRLRLTDPGQKIALQYQIDPSKYLEGTLEYPHPKKKGDLAFQLRYQRPALGSRAIHELYALGILLAGMIAARVVRRRASEPRRDATTRRDVVVAVGLGIAVTCFYGWFLLRSGFWVGASDFSKDMAYLASAAEALRAGAWPTWSHRTCGGMALLGNPEGNTISLGVLLAAILPSDKALLLLLSIEGGLAAAGTYLLGRVWSLTTAGSVAAAVVASLAGSYAYRIVEGLTPVGGAVAFLPWAFLGMAEALRTHSGTWIMVSGTAVAAMFLRGDVHVVVGVVMVAVLWMFFAALQRRSVIPLVLLAGIGSVAFLFGSIKVLPYLEQSSLIQTALPPYVVPLTSFGLLDDALLRIHDRGGVDVRPLHDRRLEQWGNFGGYVGALTLVLAGVGMLTKHPYRIPLVGAAALSFVVSEGTLFEEVLRHQQILGSLLRVPTRVLSVFALFLGLLAGIGLDRIMRDAKTPLRPWILGSLLLFLTVDLGYATGRILSANTDWSRAPAAAFPSGPTLIPHANVSLNHERHATKLTRTGFLLPKICGDQNNPPTFVKELKEETPLATVPSEIHPNRILLAAPGGPADVFVRERFTSSWTATGAEVLEHDDGSLHVILGSSPPQTIELRYLSATARPQQILFLLLLATIVAVLFRFTARQRVLGGVPPKRDLMGGNRRHPDASFPFK